MDYRILIDVMNTTHRAAVSQTHDVIKALLVSAKAEADQYSSYELLDDENARDRNEYKYYLAIYQTINTFLEQPRFVGDADDFHNLSVEFANNEDKDYACRILEIGIKCFPESVDLLADYLAYCNDISDISSEEITNEAEKYRCRLNSIPRQNWTWRGFLFPGIYLLEHLEGKAQHKLDKGSESTESMQSEIRNLISDYKRYLPMDERAYVLELRFMKWTGMTLEEQKKMLLQVIVGETPVKRVPRISFELAKIYFEEKDYPRVIEMLMRCLVDGFNDKFDNDIGEVYLMLGMSKISKYYSEYLSSSLYARDDPAKSEAVESIYADFAAYANSESYKRDILACLKILNLQTGVHNKYDITANVPID